MYFNFDDYSFYIRPGKTDMRKRSTTLAILVQNEMNLKPYDKAVFLFCSGNHSILRAITWNRNGFIEFSKKLEQSTFAWPKDNKEALKVNLEEIINMLNGQNPWRRFNSLNATRL
jgi:transposase